MFQWSITVDNYTCHLFGGLFHRVDGPAVIEPHLKQWIQNGIYHRENGPAIMNKDTLEVSHWLDGKCIGSGIIVKEVFDHYWSEE